MLYCTIDGTKKPVIRSYIYRKPFEKKVYTEETKDSLFEVEDIDISHYICDMIKAALFPKNVLECM